MAKARPNKQTNSQSLGEILKDVDALEKIVGQWDEEKRMTVIALLMSIDTLHKEAFVRVFDVFKAMKGGEEAIDELCKDEVVFAVLRHFQLVEPSLEEKVERALDTVRPALAGHGGGVKLVAVEPPSTAVVSLVGACHGCPSSAMTLSEGVEKAIKELCPEITVIKTVLPNQPLPTSIPVRIESPFAESRS